MIELFCGNMKQIDDGPPTWSGDSWISSATVLKIFSNPLIFLSLKHNYKISKVARSMFGHRRMNPHGLIVQHLKIERSTHFVKNSESKIHYI